MTMGFTSTEARLALRATLNDVDSAVEHIIQVITFKIINVGLVLF